MDRLISILMALPNLLLAVVKLVSSISRLVRPKQTTYIPEANSIPDDSQAAESLKKAKDELERKGAVNAKETEK